MSATIDRDALPAGEVVRILFAELGPAREWSDWLADTRRGFAKPFHGLHLRPYCRIHDGRTFRPHYLLSDVIAFVAAVQAADPSLRLPIPMQVRKVKFDPVDSRIWQVRKLDRAGNPLPPPDGAA